ncbi:MAG TPA: hypothetical protein VMV03_14510 [Spirochaetia bacterium]|nr:hypothetical protein [Spirochaetia bacterium]
MKRLRRTAGAGLFAAALAVGVLACTSVNRLGEFEIQGKSLAAEMRLPPPPEMDVHYRVDMDFHNPIGMAINFGTNFAKAANAERVDSLMREALLAVDVPSVVRDEAFSSSLSVLGAFQEDDPGQADYVLDLEIHRYGVRAGSWSSAVTLRVDMTARILGNAGRDVIWRRDLDVDRQATPAMFGLDANIGNIVSAASLASLSEQDLEYGFSELAHDAALTIARTLQDDLYSARFSE